MFFFRKQKFFLDLSEAQGKEAAAKGGEATVILAPPAAAPVASAPVAAPPAAVPAAPEAAPAQAAGAPVRTTAEEIAAQLAEEAASQPAPTLATFAPDCLVPGAANPRRRRTAGANLGAFKEIAKGMMKS
ncbi:MAG: hypothetical protein VKP70_06700 [Cyanobacteriota bacterium]|nr:hypothetical protein [Cyanobacteriota bacterium]